MLILATTRFEQGRERNPRRFEAFVTNFRAMAAMPGTSVLTNNLYDFHCECCACVWERSADGCLTRRALPLYPLFLFLSLHASPSLCRYPLLHRRSRHARAQPLQLHGRAVLVARLRPWAAPEHPCAGLPAAAWPEQQSARRVSCSSAEAHLWRAARLFVQGFSARF